MTNSIGSSAKDYAVFFSSPLGGGHVTAKNAKQEQIQKEYRQLNKEIDTSTYDIDFTGEKILNAIQIPFFGGLGEMGARMWNNAQKAGDLKFLTRYASMSWLSEIIFYPLVYFKVKRMLQNMEVEPKHIVMTQAFGARAIADAVLAVNKSRKWQMKIDIYFTDIPSTKAIHFLPSIKNAVSSPALQNIVRLHAPKPLLKAEETEENFWKKHCGNINVITDETYPIRQAFLNTDYLKQELEKEALDFQLKINHPSEKSIIENGLRNEEAAHFSETHATISIQKQDKVGFLMLGSQPTTLSVLNWIESFVTAKNKKEQENAENTDPRQEYLFLYCGAPPLTENNPLLDEVNEYITRLKAEGRLPSNFNIVPFTNQSANEIALLMARANTTITRSGGATTMEILTLFETGVVRKEHKTTIIHSEAMQYNLELMAAKKKIGKLLFHIYSKPENAITLDKQEILHIKKGLVSILQERGLSRLESNKTAEAIVDANLQSNNDQRSMRKKAQKLQKVAEDIIDIGIARLKAEQKVKIETLAKELQKKSKYREKTNDEMTEIAAHKLFIQEGMFLWEGKNADSLVERVGAKILNPERAQKTLMRQFFT